MKNLWDSFEQWFIGNRDKLDDQQPGSDLWKKIEAGLDESNRIERSPTRRLNPFMWAAALAAIGMVFLLGFYLGNMNTAETSEKVPAPFPDEFLEAEDYFVEQISEKRMALFSGPLDEDLEFEFRKDLQNLDSAYLSLRKTFEAKGDQDRILEFMILNLRQRLELLERQIQTKEQLKNQSNYENKVAA